LILRSIGENFKFTNWDEFASWAVNLKVFHLEGQFATLFSSNANIASGFFIGYPPSTLITEAIFLIGGEFSEKRAIFGLIILVSLNILAAYQLLVGTEKMVKYFGILTLFPIPYLFGLSLNNIYADLALGVSFLFVSVLLNSTIIKEKFGILLFNTSAAVFLLIKTIAPALLIGLLIVNVLINLRGKWGNRDNFKIELKRISSLFLFPALVWISWNLYIKNLGIKQAFTSYGSSSKISEGFSIVTGAYVDQMKSTLPVFPSGFVDFLSRNSQSIFLSSWSLLGLLVFTSITLLIMGKGRNIFGREVATWIFGFIIYQVSLILSYIFIFNQYEAEYVASLNRYNATYFVAWSLWIILQLWTLILKSIQRIIFLGIPLFVFIFFSAPLPFYEDVKALNAPNFSPVYSYQIDKLRSFNTRSEVEKISARLPKLDKNEKVYFISQDSTGFEKYMFNYVLLPIQSNYSCWSIGERYTPEDVWTCAGDLSRHLQGYSYLAVFNADERFWSDNRKYFEGDNSKKNLSIFQIINTKNGLTLNEID
jgi:hypothetical protein